MCGLVSTSQIKTPFAFPRRCPCLAIAQMEPRSIPNLNTGKPWSEMDDEDLRASIAAGDTSKAAAEFLCRNANEVRKRARELGLTWQAAPLIRRESSAKPERDRWKGHLIPDKIK
jgi:hypothetical protein